MQIRVDKLRNALKMADQVIDRKSKNASLTHVLVKNGILTATNLEQALLMEFPEAVDTAMIPHSIVSELLETVPGDRTLEMEQEKRTLHLAWPGGKAAYPTSDPRDFPDVNQKEAPDVMEEVDGSSFIEAMTEMLPYTAHEKGKDARPVLSGVTLYCGQHLTLAATDGFRVVYREMPFKYGLEATSNTAIIPSESVKLLDFLWKKTPAPPFLAATLMDQLTNRRTLTMALWKSGPDTVYKTAGLKFGTTKFITDLVQGTPPNHKEHLHPPLTNKVKVMGPDFYRALVKLKSISAKASKIVRVKWTSTEMEVYAAHDELGEVSTIIPAQGLDGPARVALNYDYLEDFFRGKEGQVTIGVCPSQVSPAQLEHAGAPVTLVMSMLAAWKD